VHDPELRRRELMDIVISLVVLSLGEQEVYLIEREALERVLAALREQI
jgi:hypothetical protein